MLGLNLRVLNKILFLTSFVLLSLVTPESYAMPIISGISSNEINIDSKFNGSEILLFGAKSVAGDIIILVRGPKKNFLINKKGKILGIWHNQKSLKFREAYSYYNFFTTNHKSGPDPDLLTRLEIGESNIGFDIKGKIGTSEKEEFKAAFLRQMATKGLYLDNSEDIEFLNETLFKVTLRFPKNISEGIYTIEVYLIDGYRLVASQIMPVYVNQVGLGAKLRNMAYKSPFLYGMTAITIAVIAGFLANFFFNRFLGK